MKIYQQLVYQNIKKDMSTALLEKILQERNGEIIDKSVMKDGVKVCYSFFLKFIIGVSCLLKWV